MTFLIIYALIAAAHVVLFSAFEAKNDNPNIVLIVATAVSWPVFWLFAAGAYLGDRFA